MSVTDIADEIRDEFAFLDDWETRYAHIIDMGKALPPLAPEDQIDTFKVRGCASQVWIVPEASEDDAIRFRAQSDAMIVSGLISLLQRLFSGQTATDILAFDAGGFFESIGINDALSAQRANGLNAMLARIQALAEARQTASDTAT